MKLKYRIAFKLRPYGKTKTAYQIQQQVPFNRLGLITSTGCQIEDLFAWDEEDQLVKSSYRGLEKRLLSRLTPRSGIVGSR